MKVKQRKKCQCNVSKFFALDSSKKKIGGNIEASRKKVNINVQKRYRQSLIFFIVPKTTVLSTNANMAIFIILRHPVTISVTTFMKTTNLTDDLLIL